MATAAILNFAQNVITKPQIEVHE